MDRAELRRVHRGLLPVYLVVFLQGFVLWYAVEKLFMRGIGFDAAGVGLAVALYSATTILAETPSGVLADRWSRRGVLALSGIALLLAAVAGGLSDSVPAYLVCSALGGVHLALASGTSDAIGYEAVQRRGGRPEDAAAVLGRLRLAEGAALVLSAAGGGLLADAAGLRTTYWLTVVPAAASVLLVALVPEPPLERTAAGVGHHVRQTLSALLADRALRPVTAVLVLLAALTYGFLDFVPLWLIALSAPVAWFGPVAAAVLVGYAAGGGLGAWIAGRRGRLGAVLLVLLAAGVALVLTRSVAVVAAAAVLLVLGLVALTVVFTGMLHDRLATAVRAGAASVVSTLGRLVLIPFALVFGAVARGQSVFAAGWLLVGGSVVVALLVLLVAGPSRGAPGGAGGRRGAGSGAGGAGCGPG